MTSITSNASLIKKVYMPKYIYPISRVASSMINFLLALVPLLMVMLITRTGIHLSLLLLLFDIICLLVFITGMSLLLTTCMTFFQDTQFLWGGVSMIWMYLTPIFYPESIIPFSLRPLYRLNPLYQFITFARTCIINGISPQPEMYDYLVSDGRNKYSVPYDLIGQTVDLRLTRNLVEVYYHGARVAIHVRLATAQRDPVVKPEHMPEAHRKYLGYNEHEFTTWAAGICPKTLDVVRHFLTHGREVEQGYKACASLTKLANRYGAARLENACARVLDLSSASARRSNL